MSVSGINRQTMESLRSSVKGEFTYCGVLTIGLPDELKIYGDLKGSALELIVSAVNDCQEKLETNAQLAVSGKIVGSSERIAR